VLVTIPAHPNVKAIDGAGDGAKDGVKSPVFNRLKDIVAYCDGAAN